MEDWEQKEKAFNAASRLPVTGMEIFFAREQAVGGAVVAETARNWFELSAEEMVNKIKTRKARSNGPRRS